MEYCKRDDKDVEECPIDTFNKSRPVGGNSRIKRCSDTFTAEELHHAKMIECYVNKNCEIFKQKAEKLKNAFDELHRSRGAVEAIDSLPIEYKEFLIDEVGGKNELDNALYGLSEVLFNLYEKDVISFDEIFSKQSQIIMKEQNLI